MRFILAITLIAVLSLLGLSKPIFAGEMNKLAHEELLRSGNILKASSKEKKEFDKYKQAVNRNLENYQEIINDAKKHFAQRLNIHNANAQTKLSRPTPKAIIFVSFSMPDLSLKQIINDATRYQLPVVVRGLIDNSFKKTASRIFELVKGNNKGGVAINPIWFKRYSINAVPACIVQAGDEFDVVYGNIRIKNMLEIIAANGSNGAVAQSILDEGKI
jgi:type-F conjugative transfer system pilin assembly protein TrbC